MGEAFPFSKARLRTNGLQSPKKFNLIVWFYNQQCTYFFVYKTQEILNFNQQPSLPKKTVKKIILLLVRIMERLTTKVRTVTEVSTM